MKRGTHFQLWNGVVLMFEPVGVDADGIPLTYQGEKLTESASWQAAILKEAAGKIAAVTAATKFEAPLIQKQLVDNGMALAAAVQMTQIQIAAKYMPRLEQEFEVFGRQMGVSLQDLARCTDPDEITTKMDRLSRVNERTKKSLLLGIQCAKELAMPAVPEINIVEEKQQPDRILYEVKSVAGELAKLQD